MQCVKCKYAKSRMARIWQDENFNVTKRRRECLRCGFRFTTEEVMRQPKQLLDDRYPRERTK